LILVDPGIDGPDLNQLADDVAQLGLPVVAGFSTPRHWDHLLWQPRFGAAPMALTTASRDVCGGSQSLRRGQLA
jgi:glyoxylase-like metal-dependent hydrolase (beta-lactamase superfamily II)